MADTKLCPEFLLRNATFGVAVTNLYDLFVSEFRSCLSMTLRLVATLSVLPVFRVVRLRTQHQMRRFHAGRMIAGMTDDSSVRNRTNEYPIDNAAGVDAVFSVHPHTSIPIWISIAGPLPTIPLRSLPRSLVGECERFASWIRAKLLTWTCSEEQHSAVSTGDGFGGLAFRHTSIVPPNSLKQTQEMEYSNG